MHRDHSPLETITRSCPNPDFKDALSILGNRNVVCIFICGNLFQVECHSISGMSLGRLDTLSSNNPIGVGRVPVPENSDRSNDNHRNSDMSPNPERLHFLDDIHVQEVNEDDQVDSGFASGGGLNSKTLSCRLDHETLIENERQLSVCGFYHPDVDSVGAMKMLKNSEPGVFLIRNSLDARFLYSLSVKTQRGATSVRIVYQEGWFSFDCDKRIRKRMPRFHSVLALIDHHVELSRRGINNSWRWEEKSGRKNMVVDISKPCRTSVPSLRHLSTIAVNRSDDLLNHVLQRPFDYEDVLTSLRDHPFKV